MMHSTATTVLVVPGLRDQVDEHWQTLLEERLPNAFGIAPLGRANLACAARVAALEDAASRLTGPLVLVAHSGGVLTVVHWARQTRRPVLGALLAAPADFETPLPDGYPAMAALDAAGWLPVPREPLPFPSIVVASRNDPLARFERVAALALAWGSRLDDAGHVGHLNPASGFGEWPAAENYVKELSAAACMARAG